MVFPAAFSTGCFLCKKRKIKCDDTKPQCLRCIKHQVQCPGYPATLTFRSETERVKRRSKKQVSQHKRGTLKQHGKLELIPSPLSPPWEHLAICYFMSQYVIEYGKAWGVGHHDFVKELYVRSAEGSTMQLATQAVAYTALRNRIRLPHLNVEARRSHAASVSSMLATISKGPSAIQEETLAAAVLLYLFEEIDGETQAYASSHTAGIYHILRAIQNSNIDMTKNTLFGHAYILLQVQALLTQDDSYADYSPFNQESEICGPISLTLSILSTIRQFIKVAEKLDAASSEDLKSSRANLQAHYLHYQHHIAKGQELHERAKANGFRPTFPDRTQQRRMLENPRPRIGRADLHVYDSLWEGCNFVLHRAALVLFYRTMVQCCSSALLMLAENLYDDALDSMNPTLDTFAKHHPELEKLKSVRDAFETTAEDLISSICASISFCLGRVDGEGDVVEDWDKSNAACAHLITWPVWLVMTCCFSTPEQKAQCKEALEWIGNVNGIKMAIDLLHGPQPVLCAWME